MFIRRQIKSVYQGSMSGGVGANTATVAKFNIEGVRAFTISVLNTSSFTTIYNIHAAPEDQEQLYTQLTQTSVGGTGTGCITKNNFQNIHQSWVRVVFTTPTADMLSGVITVFLTAYEN